MIESISHKAIALLAVLLLASSPAWSQTVRGDFNMDGDINISDAVTLINYLLNDSFGGMPPESRDTITVNGVSFVMVHVDGGVYSRGMFSEGTEVGSFSIGQTEVTQELWQAVMGSLPVVLSIEPKQPMDYTSAVMCEEFIDALNALTGMQFRLPTEIEWQYAACGGTRTLGGIYAGSNDIDQVAWYKSNAPGSSQLRSMPVAGKAPNELGLYDMSGNVSEWCADCVWTDPKPYYRALRGGNVQSAAVNCQVMKTATEVPVDGAAKQVLAGFRLAL